MAKIDVTLVKSTIGRPGKHGKVVESLGLRKMHQTVRHEDNACIRGMVNKVSHLLKVKAVEED